MSTEPRSVASGVSLAKVTDGNRHVDEWILRDRRLIKAGDPAPVAWQVRENDLLDLAVCIHAHFMGWTRVWERPTCPYCANDWHGATVSCPPSNPFHMGYQD